MKVLGKVKEMFTWLTTIGNDRRLLLRTPDRAVDSIARAKEAVSGRLPQSTGPLTVSEIVVAHCGDVSEPSAEPATDSLEVDGKLVWTNRLVRSRAGRPFEFPMTLPHRRLLVASEKEQAVREWCAMHGFQDIVVNRNELHSVSRPITEPNRCPDGSS